MPASARRGGSAIESRGLHGRSCPHRQGQLAAGRIAHAAGRGGTEADRTRHQAPAGRAEGHSRTRRAADLARRRIAHHHPLGARRCLLVGLRAARRSGAIGACCWATRPMRRPSARASPARSTCRAPAPTGRWRASSPPTSAARSISPIPAAWAARGRASASRASASFWPTACGGKLVWPDGEETEALIVAPLDSPRLTRLLGQFVDTVRRFKAGEPPTARTGLCVEPAIGQFGHGGVRPAAGRRGAARGARQARPVRRRRRISSRCAASVRSRCSRWWPTAGPRSSPWRWARCRSPRRAAAPTCGRS